MSEGRLVIPKGAAALLADARSPMPSGAFYFKGDMCQMAEAANVARKLGFSVGVGGGIPYVKEKREYDEVISYLRTHRIDGHWNYD